jgi:hypothetical protein
MLQLSLTTSLPYHIDVDAVNEKDDLTVVFAGIVHEAKGPEIIEEITKIKLTQKSLNVKIIGFSLLSPPTEERLARIDNIEIIYAPSDARFVHELINSDVVFNYRSDYQGEPSLTVLESMRQGKAAIVNRQGWFDKLPDELVYKARTKAEAIDLILKISDQDYSAVAMERYSYIEKYHNIRDYINSLMHRE